MQNENLKHKLSEKSGIPPMFRLQIKKVANIAWLSNFDILWDTKPKSITKMLNYFTTLLLLSKEELF